MRVDTGFDFRSDTPPGKDPDSSSPTLRRYHQFLWSKPLPNGSTFDLSTQTPGVYLHHASDVGEFELSSDAVIPTYARYAGTQDVIARLSEAEVEAFERIGYTIGGMMVWPGQRIDGRQTINGARGFNRSIADRMDLTLECIRLHYCGEPSPLGTTLSRYAAFFDLFGSFRDYVAFFLLDDLAHGQRVEFFQPFDAFTGPAIPTRFGDYVDYRRRSIEFVEARNRRIDAWCAART